MLKVGTRKQGDFLFTIKDQGERKLMADSQMSDARCQVIVESSPF